MAIQTAFDELLDRHGHSVAQISQGSTSHTHLRDLLGNKSDLEPSFPRLIDGDFLSGSYARGTKIYPLDDIDVMMVIDGAGFFPILNGTAWNAQVRGSDRMDNPLLSQLDWAGNLSSRVVLNHFQKALDQAYPGSKVAKDGQAVNVWLKAYGLGIDVVPCFHIIPRDGGQDVYYIPYGGENDGWRVTNPKIDQYYTDFLHKHHNQKFKQVVKLIKIWNKVFNKDRLRSYHIETVAWYVFNASTPKIEDYGQALRRFFGEAPTRFAQYCPDATKLGPAIDLYLNMEDRDATLAQVATTNRILQESHFLGLATGDRQVSGWRKIYGDNFGS